LCPERPVAAEFAALCVAVAVGRQRGSGACSARGEDQKYQPHRTHTTSWLTAHHARPLRLASSAAAHEPPDGGHQLLGLGLAVLVGLRAHDAVLGMVVKQAKRDLVERGLDRGDLREHVDAVAVVADHSLHAADLALDAPQAGEELILSGAVAAGALFAL